MHVFLLKRFAWLRVGYNGSWDALVLFAFVTPSNIFKINFFRACLVYI